MRRFSRTTTLSIRRWGQIFLCVFTLALQSSGPLVHSRWLSRKSNNCTRSKSCTSSLSSIPYPPTPVLVLQSESLFRGRCLIVHMTADYALLWPLQKVQEGMPRLVIMKSDVKKPSEKKDRCVHFLVTLDKSFLHVSSTYHQIHRHPIR